MADPLGGHSPCCLVVLSTVNVDNGHLTFLNMKRDMTACEVKRAAMRIMMMPTGTLVFRPVRAEIHPLQGAKPSFNVPPRIISAMQMHLLKVQCVKLGSICNFYKNTHRATRARAI